MPKTSLAESQGGSMLKKKAAIQLRRGQILYVGFHVMKELEYRDTVNWESLAEKIDQAYVRTKKKPLVPYVFINCLN